MHCWVSGALFPGCVTRMSFDNYFSFCGVVVVLCGVLCENCIVDASIKLHACCFALLCVVCGVRLCGLCDFFVLLCFVCSHQHDVIAAFVVVAVLVVCSLFRAHGGCLGMLGR